MVTNFVLGVLCGFVMFQWWRAMRHWQRALDREKKLLELLIKRDTLLLEHEYWRARDTRPHHGVITNPTRLH